MLIGLISDTHGLLRSQVFQHFDSVELILHAGDVGEEDILIELRAIAPVHAVIGNTDHIDLPEEQRLTLHGRQVVVTHGHLHGAPTPLRLKAAYPEADVIVYGHTHQPLVERLEQTLVVNPGAAGPARFRLKPSVAILDLSAQPQVRLVEL